ncbi:MAG: hypothetical protein M3Z02_11545, partial [Actinomycetota bacterium]|nr:hypothetical protein [Actinomycetota bacterium]
MTADLATPDSAALVTYHASAAGWWPQGDPARLRTAEAAWLRLASSLDDVGDRGRRLAWEVRAANTSDAVDAFGAFWARAEAHLAAQAAAARALAHSCREYAHAVDRARIEILALRTAEVAVAVVAAALSVVTVGASEVAAGAAAVATMAAVDAVEVTLVETVIGIVSRFTLHAAANAAFAAVEDLMVQAIRHQYDPARPIDWSETWDAAVHGAETGAAFGGAVKTGSLLTKLKRVAPAAFVAEQVPLGFADRQAFEQFGRRLHRGLEEAGYP